MINKKYVVLFILDISLPQWKNYPQKIKKIYILSR